ncbi:hypothetical protein GCM10010191_75730 [Actinomadura vinacea]|uniref:Uncharacterized protein n=1 Tax=Actinomadura vinacea TaxID=115336 RepID=A0ABN3K251_9ACTN
MHVDDAVSPPAPVKAASLGIGVPTPLHLVVYCFVGVGFATPQFGVPAWPRRRAQSTVAPTPVGIGDVESSACPDSRRSPAARRSRLTFLCVNDNLWLTVSGDAWPAGRGTG